MSRPFFTVTIPTKNRPDRVGSAVRSVLDQTEPNFELLVCDNSDATESGETAAVVEAFGDPRVRYVRTNGQLSMPDNWERAITDTRGEFVGILTDRSVFRRDALEVVRREIEGSDARVVNWFNDLYGRDPAGRQFKRRSCTLKRYRHSSETILDYFLHGSPKYATKIVPKLMTSFCHTSILDAIRETPVGRCCPPVAPDFTSGFLMLAHCDWVLTIDEPLYVSCGAGNGFEFRRGGALAERFRRDLGMEWHEIVDRMPSDACFSHALVLNDLIRIRDAIPDRLPNVELDRTQYYVGCLNDYVKAARHGAHRDEERAALLAALEGEPSAVRAVVQASWPYARAVAPVDANMNVAKVKKRSGAPPPEFDTVFEAMAWDAANPREAAVASLMDLQHGLDELLAPPRGRRPRPKLSALAADAAPAEALSGASEGRPSAPAENQTLGSRLRGLIGRAR